MGCAASVQESTVVRSQNSFQKSVSNDETVLAALTRIDDEIASCERQHPIQRLAVVTEELKSIEIEISDLDGAPHSEPTEKAFAQTMHQIFAGLDLYKRPMLAAENEDFIANVNRKEMRHLEAMWLRKRERDLQHESQLVHTQLVRLRSLYIQLEQLLDSLWYERPRPEPSLESALQNAQGLRDALASVSTRLRAAAGYGQTALRLLDDALRPWKLSSLGKSGWERTSACADACSLLVQARCQERGARRVLGAPSAPRAARSIRLALDYAFTDCLHDHKNQRATETFIQFKEALGLIVSSINKVLLNNLDNLMEAEKDVMEYRRQLRAARVSDVVRRGLSELQYKPEVLKCLQTKLK